MHVPPLKSYKEECVDPPFIHPSDGCTEGGPMKFCSRPPALASAAELLACRSVTGDLGLSVPVIAIAMGGRLPCLYLLVFVIFKGKTNSKSWLHMARHKPASK